MVRNRLQKRTLKNYMKRYRISIKDLSQYIEKPIEYVELRLDLRKPEYFTAQELYLLSEIFPLDIRELMGV